MIRINLLPDIKRDYLKAKHDQARVVGISILAILIAGGATVLLALWVYAVQNIHINLLTQNISDTNKEIRQIEDIDKYVTVQNQLANLSSLHDDKNDFSRLIDILPILNPRTPNNVRLSSLTVDDTLGTIGLEGQTSSFSGLITFRDIMQNAEAEYHISQEADAAVVKTKLFSEVTILEQGMGRTQDGSVVVGFRISAKYDPAVFKTRSRNVNITVPKLETTPSKQDAPDIFTADRIEQGEGGQ